MKHLVTVAITEKCLGRIVCYKITTKKYVFFKFKLSFSIITALHTHTRIAVRRAHLEPTLAAVQYNSADQLIAQRLNQKHTRTRRPNRSQHNGAHAQTSDMEQESETHTHKHTHHAPDKVRDCSPVDR